MLVIDLASHIWLRYSKNQPTKPLMIVTFLCVEHINSSDIYIDISIPYMPSLRTAWRNITRDGRI